MRAVGIKLLRAKLGEYVRLAAAGETVLVIDRDRILAQLGPPPPQQVETLPDALLARAALRGSDHSRGVAARCAAAGSTRRRDDARGAPG
jgi:antitoxin (DNA-binding transcriptional repressor) of toxin-antitoxin stability system